MKSLFVILIQALFILSASAQTSKIVYTCPMHPEVQRSKPGNCPKCGMALEKKTIKVNTRKPAPKKAVQKKATAQSTKVIYTCPMHPEVRSSKPGNCSKCGMTLVKKTIKVNVPKTVTKKPAGQSQAKPTQHLQTDQHNHGDNELKEGAQNQSQTKIIYTCPMHPEVQSDKPGNCPKCGMTLIKKTEQVSPSTGTQEHTETTEENEDATDIMVGSKVNLQSGKTVVYHLYVRDTTVNFTGKQKKAIAINGTIPAPTLIFTEGDTAEIHLHNMLKEETSLHWHGIILPNRFDGVPFLTTKRIGPGDIYVYKFRIVQNGTYWYHSHSALQEQVGMYGALILKKREDPEMQHTTSSLPMNHSNMPIPRDEAKPETKVVYTCVMHPEVQQDKPGNCPKCGMTLVKKTVTVGGSQQQKMPARPQGMNKTNIINPASLKHFNVVLSEWTDANPMQIQRRLRTANDWFAIKKGSTQSYSEAIKEGHFKTKFINEWKRMKAMDVSDVFYERFLVNGKPQNNASEFKAGDRVRLNVVNAGASSYFWLTYGGGKITVVANDGNDVEPVEVDRLIMGVAETFDVIVTIPENKSYEFRATAEDRTGYSSLWLGTGAKVPAPVLPRLKYFEGMKMMNDMMNVDGTMKDMGMNMSLQKMDMNMVMYPEITGGTGDEGSGNNPKPNEQKKDTMHNMSNMDHQMHGMNMPVGGDIVTLNYDMLRSLTKTSLPEGRTRVLHFSLTGNMNRYVWTLDNKTVTEADRIMIDKGENLRLILTNNSMMRHPMHLHGHDFRVVNSQGEYSPLKNVIDIMPMETDTIEFAANQDGNWFFHCHILYHMMAGMGRVFTYNNSAVNPDLPDAEEAYRKFRKHKDQSMKHLMARIGLESNGSDGEAMLSSNRYALVAEWRVGVKPHHGYEVETMFGRYLGVNQWLFPYIGFDYHRNRMENETEKNLFGQYSNQDNRQTFTAGVQYLTPWLMLADARVDGKGKFRFELSRHDIPLTPRLRLAVMGNTDKEYMAGFSYIISKWFAVSTHYDSDMGIGAGITITY